MASRIHGIRFAGVAFAVAFAGGVCAQALPEREPVAESYFTESRVVFPEIAGPFKLQRSARDPDAMLGVSMKYRYNDDFDAEFDVFVFPFGKSRRDAALRFIEAHTRATFEQAQKIGYYADVDFKRTRDVEIPIEDGLKIEGRHMRFSAVMGGEPSISHTVLSYRDGYFIKLRASSPKRDRRKFEKLVDDATTALLSKISVQSIGACRRDLRQVQVRTDAKLDTKEATQAQWLARVMNRHMAGGCVKSFDDALVPPGMKIETVRFPPGSWNPEPEADDGDDARTTEEP